MTEQNRGRLRESAREAAAAAQGPARRCAGGVRDGSRPGPSNATLLQLVINDPWFAWLHSLSELVVRIDETVEPDSPATDADAAALDRSGREAADRSETGEGFHRRYYEALQRQPAVVLAHADVRRVIKSMR